MIGIILKDRYKITQHLGEGGFAQTYIAVDLHKPNHSRCVIKKLDVSSQIKNATNAQVEETKKNAQLWFKREAEALDRLGKHDQIPTLLAYFCEQEEHFYLVMEYVEGTVLSLEIEEIINRGDRESYVIQILHDLLPVLDFVHKEGAIHRDIKPSNLIRRRKDRKIVIIDFGAVKESNRNQKKEDISTVSIGTEGYVPDEQANQKPKPASDIYALGMTCIQVLTGTHPSDIERDYRSGEVIWRKLAPTVSNDLANILDKMVKSHFSMRYESASEVTQALNLITPKSPQPIDPTLIDFPQNSQPIDPTLVDLTSNPQSIDPTIVSTPSNPKSLDPTIVSTPSNPKSLDATVVYPSTPKSLDPTIVSTPPTPKSLDATIVSTPPTPKSLDATIVSTPPTPKSLDATIVSTPPTPKSLDATIVSTPSTPKSLDATIVSTPSTPKPIKEPKGGLAIIGFIIPSVVISIVGLVAGIWYFTRPNNSTLACGRNSGNEDIKERLDLNKGDRLNKIRQANLKILEKSTKSYSLLTAAEIELEIGIDAPVLFSEVATNQDVKAIKGWKLTAIKDTSGKVESITPAILSQVLGRYDKPEVNLGNKECRLVTLIVANPANKLKKEVPQIDELLLVQFATNAILGDRYGLTGI